MSIETSIGLETGQPYPYRRVELVEPDWTRFPGWKDVTTEEWASVQWQRAHCVKNLKQLRELMGDLLDESFYADLERDQAERATMSMLVPPQMMNTMVSEMTWVDGTLTFDGTPLRDVIPALRRWYDADIQLGNPDLADMKLTAAFRDESLTQALALIAMSLDLTVQPRGTTIVLR